MRNVSAISKACLIMACTAALLFSVSALAQGALDQCNDPYAPVACVYMPLIVQAEPTPTIAPTATIAATPTAPMQPTIGPTATPAPPPPSYNNCQADPNANAAPNYPARITQIDKAAETVTLQNVGTSTVDLTGWQMCSILANQHHPIGGTLAPGQTQVFPGPAGTIWNNSEQDDGALYDSQGRLISYLTCKTLVCP